LLERLHIENLAVIESADLDLASGFTVLTGETGAGKSVLIHSLNLLLGERVGKDLVRSGCTKATVSGLFSDLPSGTLSLLNEQGFDVEDELLIQRDLASDGRSSVRINGRPATVAMLRDLGGRLVNIHGQHDNRALLDPSTHLHYLDVFAKNDEIRVRYETVFAQLKQVLRRISEINTDEQTRMQRLDLLSYQVNEIDGADLQAEEDLLLEQRRSVLANGEKIESALSTAYALCAEENNAKDKIHQACSCLERISSYDSVLGDLSERMIALSDELADLTDELRNYWEGLNYDPAELNQVEERLDLIFRLKRKYGSTVAEILAFRENAAAEIDAINGSAQTYDDLTREKELLYGELRKVASDLTDSRKKAARILQEELSAQLAFLDMPNTSFTVKIDPAGSFTPKGADAVEFLLSANLGESERPLSKIASGGELSRIMLALKTILTSEEDAQTLIFDEVDTGVSGKAAEKIAIKLRDLSRGKQAVVVTHLAQIAAYADNHYLIQKSVDQGRTKTSITVLDRTGRVDELSRIMGGLHPTDAIRSAADELLRACSGKL